MQRRVTRQRGATATGEENATAGISNRVTRAKVNALTADNTGALSNKIANSTISANPPTRGGKRSALGDVSKNRKAGEDKENGEPILKKVVSTKALMTTKASATNGVHKLTTRASAKGPLKAALTDEVIEREVKRSNSGSGVMGQRKRRVLNTETKGSEALVKAEAAIKAETKTTKVEKTVHTKSTMAAVEIADVKKEKVVAAKPTVKPVVAKKAFELEADEDDNDPLMVAEYATDIFKYLRSLEADSLPNPDYMEAQEGLQWEQRGILVDWLIEVHVKFHLLPETLYLAINIIDRFLSVKVVMIDRLQLVGITAMFIAAKYEEVFSPHIQHFRYLADDTFSEEEILRAERFMLSSLDYNLSYPNPMNFLRRISKADNYDIHTRTVAKYLMEISLVDHTLMEYLPSHVAAASMYLSRLILKRGPWDDALVYYSGYTEEEIRPVFLKLVVYIRDPQHKAFYNKYASKKYAKASILAREWANAKGAAYAPKKTKSSR